jgi:peptide/nickel transport system ATP-binding protein
MENKNILRIDDLYKQFPVTRSLGDRLKRQPHRIVHAVDGVTLTIEQGEILALVGESGSGKTTVGMNVLGLQVPTKGRILFDGYDVAKWSIGRLPRDSTNKENLGNLSPRRQILTLRRRAQIIFQDPYESLNPRQTIYEIVVEPLDIHNLNLSTQQKQQRVRAALEDCGLAPAEHFWGRYPDELSGGRFGFGAGITDSGRTGVYVGCFYSCRHFDVTSVITENTRYYHSFYHP